MADARSIQSASDRKSIESRIVNLAAREREPGVTSMRVLSAGDKNPAILENHGTRRGRGGAADTKWLRGRPNLVALRVV